MSDVETRRSETKSGDRRNQLLSRLQQIGQSKQAGAYRQVAEMLLDEIDPVRLVSALLSQVAAASATTPIVSGDRRPPRRQEASEPDVARMA